MATEGNGGNYDNPNNKPDVKAGIKPLITPEMLGSVLAKIDFYHTESSKVDEVGEQLSRVMTDTLGSPYKNVAELNEVAEQKGETEVIKKAKKYKKLLVDGVNIALREKRECGQISDDELRLGSKHLTSGLHEVINGVGGDISNKYVDKSLDQLLNKLEESRVKRNDHPNDSAYIEMLLQRDNMAIRRVLQVDSEDGDAVVVALNHEKASLRAELGREPNSSVGSVGVVEQKKTSSRETDSEAKEREPGPTVKLNETISESNKMGERIIKSQTGVVDALGKTVKSIDSAKESIDDNTSAIRESARMLGVNLKNLTTAISKEQLDRVFTQMEQSGVDVTHMKKEEVKQLSDILGKEVDDPSILDPDNPREIARSKELKLELQKVLLLRELDEQIKERQKGKKAGGENELRPEYRESWNGSVDVLYKWLNEIEKGDRPVDDLSTNSTKFGFLYRAKNSEYDNYFLNNSVLAVDAENRPVLESGEKAVGSRPMTSEELSYMKTEIDMRLWLHSFYRAASKCTTIEDITKTIIIMHEGDIFYDADRLLLSFFLKRKEGYRGIGLEGLPIDISWNLRQYGYHRIENFMNDLSNDKVDFFEYLKTKIVKGMGIDVTVFASLSRDELIDRVKKSGYNWRMLSVYNEMVEYGDSGAVFSQEKFEKSVKLKAEIPVVPDFGFEKPDYENLDSFEQNGEFKETLAREYMIWRMVSKSHFSEEKAEKAFILMKRFSIATFIKSRANLIFDQDGLADSLNTKKRRWEDGPGGKTDHKGKSKAVGSKETIGAIYRMVGHWLDRWKSDWIVYVDEHGVKQRKPRAFDDSGNGGYNPIYTSDLDTEKEKDAGYRSTMVYYALGVLAQLEFVEDAWFNKFTPNDVLAPNFLNKLLSKMNKLIYEMDKSKVKSIKIDDRPDIYNDLCALDREGDSQEKKAENKKRRDGAEVELAEAFAYEYLINLFSKMKTEKSLGWTEAKLKELIQELGYKSTIFGLYKINKNESGKDEAEETSGSGFNSRYYIKRALRVTDVMHSLKIFDKERLRDSESQKKKDSGYPITALGKK